MPDRPTDDELLATYCYPAARGGWHFRVSVPVPASIGHPRSAALSIIRAYLALGLTPTDALSGSALGALVARLVGVENAVARAEGVHVHDCLHFRGAYLAGTAPDDPAQFRWAHTGDGSPCDGIGEGR